MFTIKLEVSNLSPLAAKINPCEGNETWEHSKDWYIRYVTIIEFSYVQYTYKEHSGIRLYI